MSESAQRLDGPPISEEQARSLTADLPRVDTAVGWRGLSALESKHDAYWREVSFRESLDDVETVLGRDVFAFFQQIATVAFRPEAFAGRRLERAFDFLARHDFRVIYQEIWDVSGLQAREMWRYQWNVATLDRVLVFDLVNAQAPWLLVVLQDMSAHPVVPASVRLRGLKGSAIAENRGADSLRSACAAPNRVLSVLHATDEPVDIVRELGLLHDREERIGWLRDVAVGMDGDPRWRDAVPRVCAELYELVPHNDFDLDVTVDRVVRVLRGEGCHGQADQLFASVRDRRPLEFGTWSRTLRRQAVHLDPWDLIVVGSYLSEHDREGEVCTIDDDGRLEWMTGQGRMEWGQSDGSSVRGSLPRRAQGRQQPVHKAI